MFCFEKLKLLKKITNLSIQMHTFQVEMKNNIYFALFRNLTKTTCSLQIGKSTINISIYIDNKSHHIIFFHYFRKNIEKGINQITHLLIPLL